MIKKLLKVYSIIILLFINACTPYQYPFKMNAVGNGYVLYTNADLLDSGNNNISPSPPINFFYIPKKDIEKKGGEYKIKANAHFYQLDIYNNEIAKLYKYYGHPLFVNNKIRNASLISRTKILLKKEIRNNIKFYNKKGYRICVNNNDTINIIMNFDFMLVDDITPVSWE